MGLQGLQAAPELTGTSVFALPSNGHSVTKVLPEARPVHTQGCSWLPAEETGVGNLQFKAPKPL